MDLQLKQLWIKTQTTLALYGFPQDRIVLLLHIQVVILSLEFSLILSHNEKATHHITRSPILSLPQCSGHIAV